jgi:hypothetical protein
MAQHRQAGTFVEPGPGRAAEPGPTAWIGWVYFAGVIMLIVGCFNAIAGLVALFHDEYYLVTSNGLLVEADYTAWGWTLLIYGAVVALTGIGVLFGQTWARVIGVILAAVNALLNLGFLAAYPIWSLLIIALDVVVIYALVVHGREAHR